MKKFQHSEIDALALSVTSRLSRRSGALESITETTAGPDLSMQAIAERWAQSKAFLIQFIKTELSHDPALLDLADRVLQEGREGLELIGHHREMSEAPAERIAAGLEVIVQTDGSRPAFLVRADEIVTESSPAGSWTDLVTDITRQGSLTKVLQSVGRVDITHPLFPYAGTGWLIAPDLIATNRHVAQLFVDFTAVGAPRLRTEFDPHIDFGHEYRGRDSVNRRPITALVFSGAKPVPTQGIDHSVLDLAIFRIGPPGKPDSAKQTPLALHLGPNTADPQTDVFIAGYPGRPDPAALGSVSETEKVLKLLFDKLWGFKRLAPGIVTPSTLGPRALNHDASTLGGNSGSLIMALDRIPAVAGIHYGGNWGTDRANWGHVIAAIIEEPGLPGLKYESFAELCKCEGIVPCSGSEDIVAWAEKSSGDSASEPVGPITHSAARPNISPIAQVGTSAASATSGLHAITQRQGSFNDMLIKRLRSRACVCRLEYSGEALATGFLIGRDTIITCQHVLVDPINPQRGVDLRKMVARFDFQTNEHYQIVAPKAYRILGSVGDLPYSKYSELDLVADTEKDPSISELDYAVLRLDGFPWKSEIEVGKDRKIRRGWIDLTALNTPPLIGASLSILHHPMGQSLVETSREHSIFSITRSGSRFRHKTPTLPASSGAPCFNGNGTLIGLHHRGEERNKGFTWNSAIPINLISEDLRRKGFPLESFIDQPDGLTIRTPRKIDFRPHLEPSDKSENWKESDLIVSVLDIDVDVLENGIDDVILNEIQLEFVDFPRGRSFRWTWFADISKSGAGWLGQLGDSRPVVISRGSRQRFTAQFMATSDFNRMSWRDFHDFCLNSKRNVLETSLTFDFSIGQFVRPAFISVESMKSIFAEYDKNLLHYTRFIQPSVLNLTNESGRFV